ncbi:transketolase [Nonomuraea angiospora]|uniref:Transketolase n=1 Tax=Nonomuraea angiospora TaxID=46172 RepID=A0ABR9M276_9ACTN|nr:transketolase [Nonomuraea angiospora]MBE1587013.1 transketolase [Nonomuraea angiospora]MDX3108714.1 transketolase [Nonomuraea angiospora]
MMPERDLQYLTELAAQLRVDSVRAAAEAGSGHPTSSMSAADLMAVLFACHLHYDFENPDNPANDHLIFSKGHASPLLYALFKAAGVVDDKELLTFRRRGSRLEGHPTPRLPWVDVATGSLGQGLPVGVGVAMAGRLERMPYRVWVLCGDSELAEGSIWEAAEHAGCEGLANLTAIVDVNRLGQRGPTRHGWDTGAYARRFGAFGWHTIEIDGHDPGQIDYALNDARNTRRRPTVILAKTRKGEGALEVENREGAHGKPLKEPDKAVDELGGRRDLRVEVHKPEAPAAPYRFESRPMSLPAYKVGDKAATRTAFGEALAALGAARGDVLALDGEVADSTKAEAFGKEFPERFFEMYIAEQQLVAAAVGLQVRGWKPYAATFAAFLTRAYDFIRMAGVSRASIRLVGSHAGVAIGEDGPSQMGLEDLAMLRAVYGSTVLYPCDANQAAALTAELADVEGVSYLRTTRGETPVIYPPDERFPVGGSRVLRHSPDDRATIVAAGVTVHEALAAADELRGAGIPVGVIDLYSVKPVDTAALVEAATTTGNLITVEDHRLEGGLGDAVMDAVSELGPRVVKLAVTGLPGSATPEEQLADAGIDRHAIAEAVKRLL